MRQAPSLLVDDRQRAPPLFVGADAAERECLGEHANLGERGTQLVRDAGDEVSAQPCELRFAPQLEQRSADQDRGQNEHAEDQRQPRLW